MRKGKEQRRGGLCEKTKNKCESAKKKQFVDESRKRERERDSRSIRFLLHRGSNHIEEQISHSSSLQDRKRAYPKIRPPSKLSALHCFVERDMDDLRLVIRHFHPLNHERDPLILSGANLGNSF